MGNVLTVAPKDSKDLPDKLQALRTVLQKQLHRLHPAFLGTYAIDRRSGLVPHVLYGQLPRLIGADISIFPIYGLHFPITRDECRRIAEACSIGWGNLAPIFPTAAGRMAEERIKEMYETFGRELVFILGSQIRQDAAESPRLAGNSWPRWSTAHASRSCPILFIASGRPRLRPVSFCYI
jgi:hypothetical protein